LVRLGAPSKKNATGTCRMWEICCNRLAPMRPGLTFQQVQKYEKGGSNHVTEVASEFIFRQ
jgi:hypothetical protein